MRPAIIRPPGALRAVTAGGSAAVVEGAPPVPMVVRNAVIAVRGGHGGDRTAPRVTVYPAPGADFRERPDDS